ncbi:MAG TPA: penicillin-binding transpeptidase domain-containing protein [Verrucomicrobiae bacterium]|jgi:penicillin-binding protein 2
MLIVDELKKNDPQLRLVAAMVAAGLVLLLGGLWWVQVVSAREYQSNLQTQSTRTVRVPAVRGKILDREGRVLAESQARYNLSLYLDDLRGQFDQAYSRLKKQGLATQQQKIIRDEKELHRHLTKVEQKKYAFTTKDLQWLSVEARWSVATNVTAGLSQDLDQPVSLDWKTFERSYESRLYLPFPVLQNLDTAQIARFEEHFSPDLGANLDVQPARFYPYGTTASHLLGYVSEDDSSIEGEDSYFSYRLPDYRGKVGIEGGFDAVLHGRAGEDEVEVNNYGYKQAENIVEPSEPGENVVLTIDLDLQRAAEESLASHQGVDARGAIVVMDVRTGDVLTMVSSPAMNPVYASNSPAFLTDPKLEPQINRALYGSFAPGSIFKPVVGLAALENGLDPNQYYDVQPDPLAPYHGCIYIGRRKIGDTVPPGEYDFQRAIEQSSNSYFIWNGLHVARIENVVRLGEKFHFGEKTGLLKGQEVGGDFPTLDQVRSWGEGEQANICFGQGELTVTPLQMAVAYSAIANGGTVLWPRLVAGIEPQDQTSGEVATNFPSGQVRDNIGVSQRSMKILREAMLTETEDPAGTGYPAFHQHDSVLNLRVCGKTGTAQVQDIHNQVISHNYWFASFAPYENPKYAVVVMVQTEGSGSGGSICAPIAHDIYAEILKKENSQAPQPVIAAVN